MTQKLTVWYENGEKAEYPVSDKLTVNDLRGVLVQRGRKVVQAVATQGEPDDENNHSATTTTTTENTSSSEWFVLESGKTKVFLKLAAVRAIELAPVAKRGKKA